MNEKIFKCKNIDDDDVKIEVNLDLLRVREFVTTYNFKGEVISRNKTVGWWCAKNKNKLFKILKNNIGNMDYKTREYYLKFIDRLESEYK